MQYDPFFIQLRGIHFWGTRNLYVDASIPYSTVEIYTSNEDILVRILANLMYRLSEYGYAFKRWSTWARPFTGNRLQKRQAFQSMMEGSPEQKDIFVEWSDLDNVPCKSSELVLPFTLKHLQMVSYYR
jgi:hypothetical protein